MKRHFCLLIVTLITSLSVYAQHFKFMGVEINGTVENFSAQMFKKGFATDANVNTKTERWLNGKFAGDDVTIDVIGTPISGTVYSVVVFSSYAKESDAWNKFNFYTQQVEKKYKNCDKTILTSGDIFYSIGSNGSIYVQKEKNKSNQHIVLMHYTDTANFEVLEKEKTNNSENSSTVSPDI